MTWLKIQSKTETIIDRARPVLPRFHGIVEADRWNNKVER